MARWGEFEARAPALAGFGAERLRFPPAYFATVQADGGPRVHPVTPIIADAHLFVFMEPTSPKGRDLRERGWYALHNGVPDIHGTGGEFYVRGRAAPIDDARLREIASAAASYEPADRYVLFELEITEARCHGYGDVPLPEPRRWTDPNR